MESREAQIAIVVGKMQQRKEEIAKNGEEYVGAWGGKRSGELRRASPLSHHYAYTNTI